VQTQIYGGSFDLRGGNIVHLEQSAPRKRILKLEKSIHHHMMVQQAKELILCHKSGSVGRQDKQVYTVRGNPFIAANTKINDSTTLKMSTKNT